MNSKIKRFSAMSMAVLSLGSGMGSVINNNLDLAPKVSAVSFSKPAINNIPKFEEAMQDPKFKEEVDAVI